MFWESLLNRHHMLELHAEGTSWWITALVNGGSGFALLAIAGSMVTLVRRTRLPYPKLFFIFSCCVAACGLGRFAGGWAGWDGSSHSFPLLGIITLASSVTAAVSLRRMMPRLVRAVQGLTLSETRRRMLEDYSDELKAVNRLREREARGFEAIISSSSDQIYRVGGEGAIEYVSPAVRKFFGAGKSELRGKSWEYLDLGDETLRRIKHSQAEVLQHGREARGSLSLSGQEGLRHFDFLCSPIFEGERVIAVTFNFRDVTEKRIYETELVRAYSEMEKRVEQRTEELSLSQKRFQELVNTIDGIVWEADVGRPGFTFVGSQVERLTGYAADRWTSEPRFWQRILHPEDLAKITGDRYVYPDQKKDRQSEYRILTSDNRTLWMRDHIRVIFENGRAVKMRGIMVDVTMQKKAEEALELERAVSVKAARVKSEFLANMSHEIRTPLNAIVGMSALAMDCHMDAEARDCLSTVKTAADSLLTLVNDILDFSKIEAGAVKLELSDFRLGSVVKNAIDVVLPMAAGKGIRVHEPSGEALSRNVRGDPGRLLQIFLNLLSNAVKFTPAGGDVRFDLREAKTPGRVRFEVRDTGVGIDPELQGALFQPFTQADTSTARKFGGTGLGLSICRRLADLMLGAIGLESAPGQGSLFWFEVALPPGAEPPAAAPEEAHPLSLGGQGARVLVADDNPANQKVIRRFLEKLGYAPEVVTNGREALTALEARSYRLVLMDCQMPEMDGYEATRRIRELEARTGAARTPVVALTAHALSGDGEKCRDAGMDDYLTKPIALQTLATALARWARKAPGQGEPAEASVNEQAEPALSRQHLASLLALNEPGKADIVQELANIFFETAETKVTSIKVSAKAGALDEVRREAHSLKSTCFNVGANRLAVLCGEIERIAETGDSRQFEARRELLLGRLEKETRAACTELERYRKETIAA